MIFMGPRELTSTPFPPTGKVNLGARNAKKSSRRPSILRPRQGHSPEPMNCCAVS